MTSDISRGRLVRLPWDYHLYGLAPDKQLVADAVRASMSIPFFYEPVRFEAHDGQGQTSVSYMVDGGMLSNFPVNVFDRKDSRPPRWPTFGIKLSARADTAQAQKFQIHDTLSLAKAMVGTMTNFHDQIHIDDESVLARTIFVDTVGVRATDFDLDEATQHTLFDNGREAAAKFLATWDFDEYVTAYRTPA
jgi:NTE family protein